MEIKTCKATYCFQIIAAYPIPNLSVVVLLMEQIVFKTTKNHVSNICI